MVDVNRLLRLLAEQTKEHAMMLLDPDGNVVWWNPGAERIFGITASQILGRRTTLLFTPEDVAAGIPETELVTARQNGAAEDDRWMMRGDGSKFWATGTMLSLHDERLGALIGFAKVLRNRTDLREQLVVLRNRADAAESTSARKDVFLSTLSHELRNPLAPLANAVQLIRMVTPASVDLEYPLKVIERQVESLRRLVDDLLDLTRIGAGKIELRTERVALQEVVTRAVESTLPLVRTRTQRLDVLLPPSPLIVDADAARLEQVFVNLVNNAAKYTPERGTIWVKGTTEGDEAVVHVQDTGVGIPRDMLPHIFDLFTQVESSRGQAQGGLGIGLAVVKNLVTLHGGSIQVRSDGPGKGAEFTIRLPLAPREREPDELSLRRR